MYITELIKCRYIKYNFLSTEFSIDELKEKLIQQGDPNADIVLVYDKEDKYVGYLELSLKMFKKNKLITCNLLNIQDNIFEDARTFFLKNRDLGLIPCYPLSDSEIFVVKKINSHIWYEPDEVREFFINEKQNIISLFIAKGIKIFVCNECNEIFYYLCQVLKESFNIVGKQILMDMLEIKSIDSANNYIDAEIFELNMQWINKYIYTRNNEINKNFQVAYDCLREIDVRVKVIKFPERLSKKNKENIGCINKPSFQMLASAMYMTYKEIGNKRLKDLYIKADKPDEKRLGDYERTVYLVGPCIVSGHQVVFEYSLAYRLYQLFISNGFEYNVECVIITNHIMKKNVLNIIKELTIKKNDIVLILSAWDIRGNNIYDLRNLYESSLTSDYWYTDIPIHSTAEGNIAISEAIFKDVLKPEIKRNFVENTYLMVGKPSLSKFEQKEINEYIEEILMNNCRYRDITRMNVGAIVMNCNPFTLGHRHLIEFASKQVDFLYVFCVEEDLSAVPFEDRIYLMKQGTRDLKNVVVIPSGRFVLSRYTMPSYFRKEEQKLVVKDASCDVEIFGYYIAPKLNIKTRFVGEEPTDIVTREYNEKMRSILPELGIRFVEIPRRENEYGEIISASVVRKLVETNDYDKIKSFVPQTTFDYLRGKPVWNKINKAMVNDQKDEENKYKYKWVFDEYNGVILFGIGNKGIEYFQSLSVVDQNKVVFVDRCAHNAETFLDGREVFGPDKLQTEFKGFPIIITSIDYKDSIIIDLKKLGICKHRYVTLF